jgi:thiamine kinase-like enzyme
LKWQVFLEKGYKLKHNRIRSKNHLKFQIYQSVQVIEEKLVLLFSLLLKLKPLASSFGNCLFAQHMEVVETLVQIELRCLETSLQLVEFLLVKNTDLSHQQADLNHVFEAAQVYHFQLFHSNLHFLAQLLLTTLLGYFL